MSELTAHIMNHHGDDRLAAEVSKIELDARRYRWMRKNISDDMQWYLFGKHGIGSEGLDEAIDAAMTPNK